MEYDEELNNYIKYVDFNNKLIFDIGSNQGEIIDFILEKSTNSMIYGIEPHQHNIKILTNKFKNNERIRIFNGAINTYNGTCNIGLEEQERVNGLKQGHIIDDKNLIDMQGRDWTNKQNNIECWTLDNICKNADIIKMDIEGFEHKILYDVLPKMNTHTWLIEIHSWEDLDLHGWNINSYNKDNDSLNKMIKLFINNGYSNFKVAKSRNNQITDINDNTYWSNIPISSYQQKGKKIYYRVANIIISK
jgi:FkbM family methyltransferase